MGYSLLIVDDSFMFRRILKSCLPPESNYTVMEAGDGREAVEKYLTNLPDIVFLDLTMPTMDGVAALERIREINPDALVVVCTADIQPRSIEKVMSLGALTVLKKPPSKERVQEALAIAETFIRSRS